VSARIALQKCWNHSSREAVARCPECEHAYCRECVVEHEDRIICAGCLVRLTSRTETPKRRLSVKPALRAAAAILGLLVAWFVFFGLGRMLLSIPEQYHADMLWKRALKESLGEEEP